MLSFPIGFAGQGINSDFYLTPQFIDLNQANVALGMKEGVEQELRKNIEIFTWQLNTSTNEIFEKTHALGQLEKALKDAKIKKTEMMRSKRNTNKKTSQ